MDFYHYEGNWQNRMILGDSLLVMTSLAEKEGLKGKVQMIYIDPPYGITFGSNWQVSTRKRDVKDGKAEDMTRQPEQIRAFRDTWKLGIHSYLAYVRDRLIAARELLTESGSIFLQIGDENVHLVRSLLDEVFGADNFRAQINFRSMTALGQEGMASVYDYILWYCKDASHTKFRPLYDERPMLDEPEFCYLTKDGGEYERLDLERLRGVSPEEGRRVFKRSELRSSGFTPSCTYEFEFQRKRYHPSAGKSWRTHPDGMKKLIEANRLVVLGTNPYFRQFYSDFPVTQIENSWHDTAAGFSETKIYVVQTNLKIIERCLLMTTDPGDLVLDPTCGSGTTAYVAEQWGRRWITCDTSRVALALARTRLMAAKFPYYLLADSPEGVRREAEVTGQIPKPVILSASEGSEMLRVAQHDKASRSAQGDKQGGDIRKGFVYKRVPHVTLKSIANNPDIKEGMTREQIDVAIASHAETELLYDQPYEDPRKIRVTGPFTVESLSPYRLLSTDEERPATEVEARKEASDGQFATMIIENLKKAGVQNTFKNERLKFDRLEPYAGKWIHAAGEYTEKDGKTRRAAISIGPEHATVGPEQVKEAAKEAVQGVGFDLLVVCGFAFDPHVSEEAKRYGKLTVMPTRMNYDLTMGTAGEELLKKTGAGNLFMYFGEPDIEVKRVSSSVTLSNAKGLGGKRRDSSAAPQNDKGEKLVVTIKGLDIYDPTTGQIRSHSTDDIACWFIDTNYNGESFFVRHAYFTGAEEPYDKLKRALRAEIDEAAWSALYSTTSRPFDPPKTGKIAIKVINHYGDEVLKVYETNRL